MSRFAANLLIRRLAEENAATITLLNATHPMRAKAQAQAPVTATPD